jgi:hypothetical protein
VGGIRSRRKQSARPCACLPPPAQTRAENNQNIGLRLASDSSLVSSQCPALSRTTRVRLARSLYTVRLIEGLLCVLHSKLPSRFGGGGKVCGQCGRLSTDWWN